MQSPDVVVVGGGLIGLLTAAELAERGASVTVIEKDDIGFEQSARSVAAVNLPGGSTQTDSRSMLRVSADEWSTFDQRWGCDINLNADGWHIVIVDDADADWVSIDRATWQETAGYSDSEMLDADMARRRFPQLEGEFRSLDNRHGGHVDAVRVMTGLRDRRGETRRRRTLRDADDWLCDIGSANHERPHSRSDRLLWSSPYRGGNVDT